MNDNQAWSEGGFTTRAATLDDVDMVVDLSNAIALAETGMLSTHRDDKLVEWGVPYFYLETDTMLVLAPGGQAAAFAQLWDWEPHVRHYWWGGVHPDYRHRGLGSHLMEWAEARARRSLDKAASGARVSIHTSCIHHNKAAQALFEEQGYTLSRYFLKMLAEMAADAPPPAPVWPEGITVRRFLLGQDDRATYATLSQAFRDHWGHVRDETFEEWYHWIESDPAFDPSVCFLAVTNGPDGGEIVGALLARLEWEGDPSIAWIDELGVLRPWRRKGIGLALLHQVEGEFHRRGRYKVGLGVDGDSLTGATRLYEQAGMRVFRRTAAYEKVLRPGKDLSVQSLET
jgi:ribosomal protein S18 acetylase RimI-like enzyme